MKHKDATTRFNHTNSRPNTNSPIPLPITPKEVYGVPEQTFKARKTKLSKQVIVSLPTNVDPGKEESLRALAMLLLKLKVESARVILIKLYLIDHE